MKFDINVSGTANIKVKHANYGNDTGSKWKLQSSIDGGITWQDVDGEIICTSEMQEQTFTITHTGNIRFKILKTGAVGKRINIDDFEIFVKEIPTDPVSIQSISIEGSKEVLIDNTTKLNILYTPEKTTERGVIWESLNENIATVDENGIVRGVAQGKATITAVSTHNNTITASHEITVKSSSLKTIEEAKALPDGNTVSVQGTVTFIDSNNNYYIQDDTGGIDLFKNRQDLGLSVGDMAAVTGKLATYRGLREIVPDGVVKVSSNNPLPEPKLVTIKDVNNYQSQRVKIENVTLGTINTDGNTEITNLQGNKINIYRIPMLKEVKEGDLVNVTAVASIFDTPQLRVRVAEDIIKTELGEDEVPPVIDHTPIMEGNINLDLEVKAKVTDNRKIEKVKLYYRTKGEKDYKSKEMTLIDEEYGAVIPKVELNILGLEYYIWATDGTNEITDPKIILILHIL